VEEVVDALQDHITLVLVVNTILEVKEVVTLERQLRMDVHISSREVHVIPLHNRQSANNTFLVSIPHPLNKPC